MNVLLDESVPRTLKSRLEGHAARTVPEMGWSGKKNGELLRLAEDGFDVFITADQNLRHQQNLPSRKLSVIVLPTNRVPDMLRLAAAITKALKDVQPGGFIEIPLTVP